MPPDTLTLTATICVPKRFGDSGHALVLPSYLERYIPEILAQFCECDASVFRCTVVEEAEE